jgi:hypothetical protein
MEAVVMLKIRLVLAAVILSMFLLIGCEAPPPPPVDKVDYIEFTLPGGTYRYDGAVIDTNPADYKLMYTANNGADYVHIMLPNPVASGTFRIIPASDWYFNTWNLPVNGQSLDANEDNMPFTFVITRNGSEVSGTFTGEVQDGFAQNYAISGSFFSDEF